MPNVPERLARKKIKERIAIQHSRARWVGTLLPIDSDDVATGAPMEKAAHRAAAGKDGPSRVVRITTTSRAKVPTPAQCSVNVEYAHMPRTSSPECRARRVQGARVDVHAGTAAFGRGRRAPWH